MRAVTCHASLVALLALTALACEDRPTRPTPPAPSGTPASFEIRGPTRFSGPGESGVLTAVAVYPNGMRADATTFGPVFSIPGGSAVATIVSSGFVRATAYGQATVQMTCRGLVATTQVTVLPVGTFLLAGQVTQGGQGVPVVQAKVDFIMPGQSYSTVTDGAGRYALPAVGPGTLRVEASNYGSRSLPVTVNGDTRVDVTLDRTNDQFNGTYVLTFTASPSCSLPSEVTTRRYIATVDDSVSNLVVHLSGANFAKLWIEETGFSGTRSGNAVHFVIADDWESYSFIEDLGNNRWLVFQGEATGTIESGQLKTIFSGTVSLYTDNTGTTCTASDHRLDFTR